MTTWQDVLIVAINIAGLCFLVWCVTRPSKG
jgi:hypothetical protein